MSNNELEKGRIDFEKCFKDHIKNKYDIEIEIEWGPSKSDDFNKVDTLHPFHVYKNGKQITSGKAMRIKGTELEDFAKDRSERIRILDEKDSELNG